MSNELEYKLIRQAIDGDQHAFEQLIIPYEQKVYNIALQMFKNEHDAKDSAQEVFIKVYKNLVKFNFESAFGTWLHRLTMNTCIDEYRKRKRHMTHTTSMANSNDDDGPVRQFKDEKKTPEEQMIQNEVVAEVRTAMDHLKEEQKLLLIYRDIQGYTYDEIAEMLECNLGTIKSRISRARKALKEIIVKNREQIVP